MEKPVAVAQYNNYLGGVNHADKLLSYYDYSHCTLSWWRRAFFFLLTWPSSIAIFYMLPKVHKGNLTTNNIYIVELAADLLISHLTPTPPLPHHVSLLAPLTEHHFLTAIWKNSTGHFLQLNCSVCCMEKGRWRKTTTYKSRLYDPPVCGALL